MLSIVPEISECKSTHKIGPKCIQSRKPVDRFQTRVRGGFGERASCSGAHVLAPYLKFKIDAASLAVNLFPIVSPLKIVPSPAIFSTVSLRCRALQTPVAVVSLPSGQQEPGKGERTRLSVCPTLSYIIPHHLRELKPRRAPRRSRKAWHACDLQRCSQKIPPAGGPDKLN